MEHLLVNEKWYVIGLQRKNRISFYVQSSTTTIKDVQYCVVGNGNGGFYPAMNMILREVEAPAGYEKADDIVFSIHPKKFSTEIYAHGDTNSPETVEGWYPYIDTGDGQERNLL